MKGLKTELKTKRRKVENSKSSGLTRVDVTRGNNWRWHPYFSRKKTSKTFFSRRYTVMTFFRRVVQCSLQIRPQFFSFGCHPHGWCHPGQSSPPPSDATEQKTHVWLQSCNAAWWQTTADTRPSHIHHQLQCSATDWEDQENEQLIIIIIV